MGTVVRKFSEDGVGWLFLRWWFIGFLLFRVGKLELGRFVGFGCCTGVFVRWFFFSGDLVLWVVLSGFSELL